MADLPILLALLAVAAAAALRPWVGVLGLIFVGVMVPQSYATGWLKGAPVYLAIGAVVALSTLRQFIGERRLPALFWDWRMAVMLLLAVQMVLSTWLGINPLVGWTQLADIAKSLPLLLLVLLLIDGREKLRWLLLTVALSVAVVVLKGGFWALATGLENRVYGPPGSQYGGNNEFAVAVAMSIPLLALAMRQAQSAGPRWVLGGLIGLAFVAALSSWSRGALLCLLVVSVLLVLDSRRRWVLLPVLGVGLALLALALPGEWFDRMQTLRAPGTEDSAAARLDVWRAGWAYALQHPWFGGGLGGWIYLSLPVGRHMAWHSAYVSVLAEHGFVGLVLWGTWLFGTLASLTATAWRCRRRGDAALADTATMLCASLAAYAVGSAFLSIAYWELLLLLLVAAIVLRRISREPVRAMPAPP